jgi:hypothetical protein
MSDLVSTTQRQRYPDPPLAPHHYRMRTRVLNCDGVLDASGDVFEPDSVYWPPTQVPIQHEFKETPLSTWGYASLEAVKDDQGKTVGIDAGLDFQLPEGQDEDLFKYLHASIGGIGIESRVDYPEKGQTSWTKVGIQRIGLTLSKNCDHRITTLAEMATRLDTDAD